MAFNKYFSPILGFLPKNLVGQIQIYFNEWKSKSGSTITFTSWKFSNTHRICEVAAERDVALQNQMQVSLHEQTTYLKDQALLITHGKGCSSTGFKLAFAEICDGIQTITKDEDDTFKTNEIAIYLDNLKVSQEVLGQTFDSVAWLNMITRDGTLFVEFMDFMNYGKTYYYNNLIPDNYKPLAIYLNVIYQKDKPKVAKSQLEAYINEKMSTIKIGQHLYQDNFFDATIFDTVSKFQMTSTDLDHTNPVAGTHFQQVGQRWLAPVITITENMETALDSYNVAKKQGRLHSSCNSQLSKNSNSLEIETKSEEISTQLVLIFKIGKFYLYKMKKVKK